MWEVATGKELLSLSGHKDHVFSAQFSPSGNRILSASRDSTADAIKKFFEGRVGILDFDGNFDIDIQYPFPSAERFDRKKYESVFQRLSLWLGPVGLMLLARDTNEFLLRLLKASVLDEREEVGGRIGFGTQAEQ